MLLNFLFNNYQSRLRDDSLSTINQKTPHTTTTMHTGSFLSSGTLPSLLVLYMPLIILLFARSFFKNTMQFSVLWFTTTILLSTPYAIYIIVWTQSDAFISLIKQLQLGVTPIDLFAYLVYAIKLLQLIVLTLYFFAIGFMWKFSPIRTVMGTIIFAFGQFLNVSTYHTIGYNGVHYGCRLNREKPVPWVSGFPFNVVSHPQYVGSVLSIWGILLVVWNLRLGFAPVWMACMWTWYYVVVSKVESLL